MKLKTAKILRSRVPGILTDAGVPLPVGSRVVVMSSARVSKNAGKPQVKAFVADPQHPDLENQVVIASPGAFRQTFAGRPPVNA